MANYSQTFETVRKPVTGPSSDDYTPRRLFHGDDGDGGHGTLSSATRRFALAVADVRPFGRFKNKRAGRPKRGRFGFHKTPPITLSRASGFDVIGVWAYARFDECPPRVFLTTEPLSKKLFRTRAPVREPKSYDVFCTDRIEAIV